MAARTGTATTAGVTATTAVTTAAAAAADTTTTAAAADNGGGGGGGYNGQGNGGGGNGGGPVLPNIRCPPNLCKNFNFKAVGCTDANCKFAANGHKCAVCGQNHPARGNH